MAGETIRPVEQDVVENTERSEKLAGLKAFLEKDMVDNTIPYLTEYTDGDEQDAKTLLDNLEPAVVVKPEDITSFETVDYNPIDLRGEFAKDPFIAGDLLRVGTKDDPAAWLEIRRGEAGSEKILKVYAELARYAPNYAAALLRTLDTTRKAGYEGFGDFFDRHGYTEERMAKLFAAVRDIKDTHFPHVTHAAEIRRQDWPKAYALVSEADIRKALAGLGVSKIHEIISPDYDDQLASAFSIPQIYPDNSVALKVLLVRGEKIDPDVAAHELAHVYLAVRRATEGDVLTGGFDTETNEHLAYTVGGIDIGEALFFNSGLEAGYRFSRWVDGHDNVEEITEALASGRVVAPLFATGLQPLASAAVVPFGAYGVPYQTAMAEALTSRQKLEGTNPDLETVYRTVVEAK